MKWTRMNYRHSGWQHGYRYFVTWTGRQGLWGSGIGNLVRWLQEEYGPYIIQHAGPPTREDCARFYWHGWHLGHQLNPHWHMDQHKRRIYVTEEALMWARLKGRCD